MNSISGKIVVSGYAETPVSRARVDKGEPKLTAEEYYSMALHMLLKQTGLEKRDLKGQGVGVAGSVWPHAEIWSAELVQNLGLEPKYLVRADQGGANGAALLVSGILAIHSGYVDHFLILGADAPMSLSGEGPRTWRYEDDYLKPFGMMGPNSMMAMVMRRQMHLYGYKPEHYGKVSVVQRGHATLNPNAYLRTPIKMEDYLASPMISDPVRLLDICIFVNGGLALLLSSQEKAKTITDKPVLIKGFGEWHNPSSETALPDVTTSGVKESSKQAYEMAGVKPSDIDLFNPYDDYTAAVLMQLEDAGFCPKGGAGKLLEEIDISNRGQLPINTGGGQLSAGQAGMVGGLHHIVEAVRQLREEAGERQVRGAMVGLVTSLGGLAYGGSFVNNYTLVFGAGV
ncbi:MAG: thiolase family protein [Nitrososphaerota archaeon]